MNNIEFATVMQTAIAIEIEIEIEQLGVVFDTEFAQAVGIVVAEQVEAERSVEYNLTKPMIELQQV